MLMYNLIEYSDNHSKTSKSFSPYYRDEPNANLAGSESFKSQIKITGSTLNDGNTKNVEITVLLKYLNIFWRTLEMPLMKCENLILTWSSTFTITNATGERKFAITDKKSYVTIVTLSNQDSAKLLQILKLGFKRTIS